MSLGLCDNLLDRPRYENLKIASSGTCSKQLTTEQILQGTAWAWFTLPKELFMWSFVSVGYVTREDMARMNGMSVDTLEAH